MMFPENTTEPGKDFLGRYVRAEDFPAPEENLVKTRNERWPTRWERVAQGRPDMTILSEERRSNYV
jgi:hypothetical protein